MEFTTIKVQKEEGIAVVTLNRPHRRNALNEKMWEELSIALRDVAEDDGVRVMVLTGAGEAFSVGADLGRDEEREKILEEPSAEEIRRGLKRSHDVVRLLAEMEKPTIAMVNGVAAGGGFDWALACDIRIGSERARFRSYTQIGLIPGQGGAWLMVRAMGYPKAAEMMFTADIIDAREAERIGLLNRLVPAERLEEETLAMARRIAQNPPVAIRVGKLLLRKALEMSLDTSLEVAALSQPVCIFSEDHKEALNAFREKRQPRFTGR